MRLAPNLIGTSLYKYDVIVGDIVILKEEMTEEGMDFAGLTDQECEEWIKKLGL